MSRDALIETGGAAAGVALAALIVVAPGLGGGHLASLALLMVVGWIVWRDASDFIIPDGASIALAALAFAARAVADGPSLETVGVAALEGFACGGALWAVREAFYRLRGHDGLGFGDVKLAAASGVLVGIPGFAVALLAACLAGLAAAAVKGALDGAGRLPLGALLAPAVLAAWLLGLGPQPGLLG